MLAAGAYVALLALLALPTVAAHSSPCLCIFDLDRTLTGKQGDTHHCPNNKVYQSVRDPAYGGGLFTLSQGALHLNQTFCNQCYVGVISAGHAGGDESELRSKVVLYLNWYKSDHLRVANTWVEAVDDKVKSPLVIGVSDGHKHHVASGIRDWYMDKLKVHISAQNTHFFDDVANNVAQFKGFGYQARQISCKSRDNTKDDEIGYCGMTVDEVVNTSGIHYCANDEAYISPSANATAGQASPSCWDQTLKAGFCDGPQKCPSAKYAGQYSVYVVPCSYAHATEIYNIDPGWGGAHITMTSFQTETKSKALEKFNELKDSLHSKGPKWIWHPESFSADEKTNGVRRLDIKSENLDHMVDPLKSAGWVSPTKKGNWHITLANMTNEPFHTGDKEYKYLTSWLGDKQQTQWAAVLVHCYEKDGQLYFHHENGFLLNEWTNHQEILV